jgi:hypothetical protein
MQVVFMVGGLGSNRYLTKYIKSRIEEFGNFETVVKQPSAGYASPQVCKTANCLGAVWKPWPERQVTSYPPFLTDALRSSQMV